MDSTPMTIYVTHGIDETILLEVNPSDTLAEVKKKLIEKGAKASKYTKFISNGKVLRGDIPLPYQGVQHNGRMQMSPDMGN